MAVDPAGFRKTGNRVELKGTIAGGTDVVVFTLPEGYRPASEQQFQVASGSGTSVVTISPNGDVLADPNAGWVSLNGISFEVG